jgi:hypothetical protein
VKGLIAVIGALVLASSAHATAHSIAYTRAGVSYFRTTPQNALYQARDCVQNGLAHCGDFLTRGDGDTFADDCRAAGRTATTFARSLRYWARCAPALPGGSSHGRQRAATRTRAASAWCP